MKLFLRCCGMCCMKCEIFAPFLLVGGTALSLQLGHRVSDDIDLFTDAEYGSLDFQAMQSWLRNRFPYCIGDCGTIVGFGASYIVGNSREESVKVDLFYRRIYSSCYRYRRYPVGCAGRDCRDETRCRVT